MCVACGLPTTHSTVLQTLGTVSLFSFFVTTFIGAWWILTSVRVKNKVRVLVDRYVKK
jgi:hypothetical protein